MKRIAAFIFLFFMGAGLSAQEGNTKNSGAADSLNGHKVLLDAGGKIISWMPQAKAYDSFLRQRWNFIKTGVPFSPGPAPRSSYPIYYFYCAYLITESGLQPDTWMNDIGERIPNWFESARLYYAYTGDSSVMKIVQDLIDYAIDHGTSPADFAWPNFPYTTTNAGDTIFRGFTSAKRFVLDEIQVDHAGDMGLAYFRLYQFTGDTKYRRAAVDIANTLAAKARTGTAVTSVWPYRVVMSNGEVKAEYGANWFGCYSLLDQLVKAGIGNRKAYRSAMEKARSFILDFPMKTGYWTDGHTDTDINSNTYKSNMSASNAKLFMFDNPVFNPDWKKDLPALIRWTEDNFINRSVPGEPSNQWGANIVGEQDSFLYKMDYQTARYAAECARWYAVSGDASYKEKAFRSFNWVTYCSDAKGLATESPVSKGINSWWSDCYGEGPMMFYPALAAVPDWAPPGEDHILYSAGILKNVNYLPKRIQYDAVSGNGTEYLRISFKPGKIVLNGKPVSVLTGAGREGYILAALGNDDYALTLKRADPGTVIIAE